jgi:hypothetical protein
VVAADQLASAVTRLADQLDEVSRIARFEPALLALRVERVSLWSIGLQVDHILKVLEAGQRLLAEESPTLPRGMNLVGRFALATGWVPRGVGKSPKGVLPVEQGATELAGRSSELRKIYCERPLPAHVRDNPRPVFKHPYFGGLSAAQGLRFLVIHTHHHMKIVADIRRAG